MVQHDVLQLLLPRFVRLPEVEVLDEPLGVEDVWSRFAMAGRYSPNLWTDAYLAAFAVRAGR
jgi:predicted nucleic acid-binding protein